jgi:hypothetical protein
MRRHSIIWLIVTLLLSSGVADARWFQRSAGPAELRQIARTLMATPTGGIREDVSTTRDPEAPAPPSKASQRKHDPILTAECAKSIVFAGPGLLTALIEVGLEAANVKAADLLPTAEEALYNAHAGESKEDAPTEAEPAAEEPETPEAGELPRIITPFAP